MIINQQTHASLIAGLSVLLLVALIWSLLTGEAAINPAVIFSSSAEIERTILFDIRLPRLLLAALVGAGLAVSGTAIQGVFRNPLADPALIGVSSGAAFAAALAMVFWPSYSYVSPLVISMSAFAGGLLVSAIVFKIATAGKQTRVANLLLAGVAINALVAAGLALLGYVVDTSDLRKLIFWSMGSLAHANWYYLSLTAVMVLPALILLPRKARGLNLFLLGEDETRHLGQNPEKIKLWTIILVALAVGAMVAATGVIGFVGLVIPHLGRFLVGPDHRILFPVSALLGACLLVIADLIARSLIAPVELPVGVLTAFLGVPFFIWLLIRS